MPSVATPSKAGIVEAASGERHIPSSVRADGSKRKEIKIRPGYKPPEDVEVYKNRTAESFRTRGGGGVPGAEGLKDDEVASPASNKNAKRREARKKAKAAEDESADTFDKAQTGPTADVTWRKEELPKEEAADPEAEKDKKARNLKKKLKQDRELK